MKHTKIAGLETEKTGVSPDPAAMPVVLSQAVRRPSSAKAQCPAMGEGMAQSGSLHRSSAYANDEEVIEINPDWLAFWRHVRALAAEHDRAEEKSTAEVDS